MYSFRGNADCLIFSFMRKNTLKNAVHVLHLDPEKRYYDDLW